MGFYLIFKIQILLTMSWTAAQTESTTKEYFPPMTFRNAVATCQQGNGKLIDGDVPSGYNVTWISQYRVRTDWIYTNGCINSDNVVGSHLNFSLADNDVTACFHACLLKLRNSSLRYIALQDKLCICLRINSLESSVSITTGCDLVCDGETNTKNRCGGNNKYSLYEIVSESRLPYSPSRGFCAYQNSTALDITSCGRFYYFACKSTEGVQTIVNTNVTWNKARENCQSMFTELNTELLDNGNNVWIGLRIMTQILRTTDISANTNLDDNYFRQCTLYYNDTRKFCTKGCLKVFPFYCIYETTGTATENNENDFIPNTEGNVQKPPGLLVIICSSVAASVVFIIVAPIIIYKVRRSKRRNGIVTSEISHQNVRDKSDSQELQNVHMYDSARDLHNIDIDEDKLMKKKGQEIGDLGMYDHTKTSSRQTMRSESVMYDHVNPNENMYDKAMYKPQHDVPNDLYDHMSAK